MSSAIRRITRTKGQYNTKITFTDGSQAEYNLTQAQRNKLQAKHAGTYYNKFIRLGKKTK